MASLPGSNPGCQFYPHPDHLGEERNKERKREKMSDKITISMDETVKAGNNVQGLLQGRYLILVIDTTVEIGPSASGKMIGIASTEGFQRMPGDYRGNFYLGKRA